MTPRSTQTCSRGPPAPSSGISGTTQVRCCDGNQESLVQCCYGCVRTRLRRPSTGCCRLCIETAVGRSFVTMRCVTRYRRRHVELHRVVRPRLAIPGAPQQLPRDVLAVLTSLRQRMTRFTPALASAYDTSALEPAKKAVFALMPAAVLRPAPACTADLAAQQVPSRLSSLWRRECERAVWRPRARTAQFSSSLLQASQLSAPASSDGIQSAAIVNNDLRNHPSSGLSQYLALAILTRDPVHL